MSLSDSDDLEEDVSVTMTRNANRAIVELNERGYSTTLEEPAEAYEAIACGMMAIAKKRKAEADLADEHTRVARKDVGNLTIAPKSLGGEAYIGIMLHSDALLVIPYWRMYVIERKCSSVTWPLPIPVIRTVCHGTGERKSVHKVSFAK